MIEPIVDAKAPDTAGPLLTVTMQLMKRLAAHMRHSSLNVLPAHAGMLVRIGEGPCSISELAKHQCVQLPTVSRSVNVLVERGLVERSSPENDRRKAMLRLTAHGRSVINKMMRDAHTHTELLLSSLSETDRRRVRDALQILLEGALATPALEEPGQPRRRAGSGRNT